MKKALLSIVLIFTMLFIVSCKDKNKIDAVKLAKDFYTEYLNESDYNKLFNIKEKYMTMTLIQELELRTMEMESDSITGVQDPTGMEEIMEVNKGVEDNMATVTFNFKKDDGTTYRLVETSLRFKNVDDKVLMDTLDMIIIEYDENNNDTMRQYQTKYANKDELTEEDKKEIKEKRKYYENLYSQGYIN